MTTSESPVKLRDQATLQPSCPPGKPEAGRIEIRVQPGDDGLAIVVVDDGRGLRLDRLRARFGASESDEALAEVVLRSGVSTAQQVKSTSGRGVGLDAVRDALGGRVRIGFTGPERGGCRPFEIVLGLPGDAWAASA